MAAVLCCQAQITITKDYYVKGRRIIEFSKDGVAYSMSMSAYDIDARADLVFLNLQLGKSLNININAYSDKPIKISYGEQKFLEVSEQKGQIHFDEFPLELSSKDKRDLSVFSEALDEIDSNWPLNDEDPGGGSFAPSEFRWRAIAVRGGGTRSLAEKRCEKVFEEHLNPGCSGTIDCYSTIGHFLSLCLCGEICE